MSELGDLVRAANHWQPGMGRTPDAPSWSIFDDRPGQTEAERAVRESAKLLATRIDRGAPAHTIESARRALLEVGRRALAAASGRVTPAATAEAAGSAPMPRWQVWLVFVVACFLAGMLLGKAWRSGMVGYAGRSAVRGLIYRGVGALGK